MLFRIEAEAYTLKILSLYNPALSNQFFLQNWSNIHKMIKPFWKTPQEPQDIMIEEPSTHMVIPNH